MAYFDFRGIFCVIESGFETIIANDEVVAWEERHDGAFSNTSISDNQYGLWVFFVDRDGF